MPQIINAAQQLHNLTATAKGHKEFAMLINLKMACLLARTADVNADHRVRDRLKKLEQYLFYYQPSILFHRRFIQQRSEIGSGFVLHFGINGVGIVHRKNAQPSNVLPLLGGRHAAANE